MKVDIVCFTGNSGLTDYSVSLARALQPLCATTLITSEQITGAFRQYGFPVLTPFRRSRHFFLDIFKFVRLMWQRRPDWVIFQGPLKFPLFDALVVYLLRMIGIRALITVHDVLPHYPRWWSRYEYGFYYRAFDRVIVHSPAAREGCQQLGIRAPMLTVPHGVYDLFNLNQLTREKAIARLPGVRNSDLNVLFFGHLEPRKGFIAYLQAAQQMVNEPGIRFLIAGAAATGTNVEYARGLEWARGADNVVLADRRIPFEEVECFFAACDVVALPYLEGTTSGVLKLALAFGKPVIITRVGDLPSEMPEGAGLIIEPDAELVTSLCAAIRELKQAPDRYCQAMQQAAGRAQWPDIARQVRDFLFAS